LTKSSLVFDEANSSQVHGILEDDLEFIGNPIRKINRFKLVFK